MGWFDDSDSEEERSKKRAKKLLLPLDDFTNFTTNNTNATDATDANTKNTNSDDNDMPHTNNSHKSSKSSKPSALVNSSASVVEKAEESVRGLSSVVDEQEDPLEAYMASIISTSQQQTTSSSTKQQQANDNDTQKKQNRNSNGNFSRLDVDNEEEATAHWTTPPPSSTADHAGVHEEEMMEDDTSYTSSSSVLRTRGAKRSSSSSSGIKGDMASIFHKAGDTKSKQSLLRHHDDTNHPTTTSSEYNCHYDSEEEEIIQEQITKRQKRNMEHHYTISKNQTSKSSSSYPTFRKDFSTNSNIIKSTSFGKQWRKDNHVNCSIDIDPILQFTSYYNHENSSSGTNEDDNEEGGEVLLPKEVIDYLQKNHYNEATLVQAQSIPVALSGKDLLVTSHTGSGKTLAFVLPLITHILDQPHITPNLDGPIVLILTPTRELAHQVNHITKKILHTIHAKSLAITGGMGYYEMSKELKKGCEVIISTPGRLVDMMTKQKVTNCHRVTLVILDEGDKMLDMGFETQVSSILENVRTDCQKWMFSATFGKRVERVANGWLKNPVRIAIGRTGSFSEHVEQHIFVLPSKKDKIHWLLEMTPILVQLGRMIIFVSSRKDCEELTTTLLKQKTSSGGGLLIDSIHGDKHQSDRTNALSSLRKGKIQILVATDVAARGLDVTDIMTVVNFDAAKNLDSHIHRCGRAGRLSSSTSSTNATTATTATTSSSSSSRHEQQQKKGNAYTLLTHKNADFANVLVNALQREGREVSTDLERLAMNSRHNGGGGGGGSGNHRHKWKQSGLGFSK